MQDLIFLTLNAAAIAVPGPEPTKPGVRPPVLAPAKPPHSQVLTTRPVLAVHAGGLVHLLHDLVLRRHPARPWLPDGLRGIVSTARQKGAGCYTQRFCFATSEG